MIELQKSFFFGTRDFSGNNTEIIHPLLLNNLGLNILVVLLGSNK